MGLISGSFVVDILALALTIAIGCYTYFRFRFNYWKEKGVPYVEPTFPFGSIKNPISADLGFGHQCQKFYKAFKPKGHKHVGFYALSAPMYMPLSLNLVKSIMVSDFDYFMDRGMFLNEEADPLSAHLFSMEGVKWRNMRVKLTPTFTSGKMKMMFPTLVECGYQLKAAMDGACGIKEPIDIKDFAARFTTNVIGSCAFGIECNCFKDRDSEFRKYGKRVFTPEGVSEILKGFIGFVFPGLVRKYKLVLFSKDVTKFFMTIIRGTVQYREENNIIRKDFMQLLMDIKNSSKDENGKGNGLTFEELAAQAFVFFVAGYETSSTTMTFCLFELASNPDIQEKLREEIEKVLEKHGGEITYEGLSEMKYMDQVIDETLRKYPPLTMLNRKCVKDYKIPNSDIVLENGTPVIIPVIALHHDPDYFPNPEKFDPERFSEANKSKILPFTYLPFGDGPRVCIGIRFGVMQTKVGLAVLLKNYKFSLNKKTTIPLVMDPFTFVLSVKDDIWLNAEKV